MVSQDRQRIVGFKICKELTWVRKILIFSKIGRQRTETVTLCSSFSRRWVPAGQVRVVFTVHKNGCWKGQTCHIVVCMFYSNILRHNQDINEIVWKNIFLQLNFFKNNGEDCIYELEMGNYFLNKTPHKNDRGKDW